MYCYYDCCYSHYYILHDLADGSRVLSPRIGIIWIALVYIYDRKCACVHVRVPELATGTEEGL